MNIGGRKIGTILKASLEKRHYTALKNMLIVPKRPLSTLSKYLLSYGQYPQDVELRTKLGTLTLRLFSKDDLLTINEIFCRVDYPVRADDRVIVDFGSNIGISAAYFLSEAPGAHAYLYEPLPVNVARLKDNLRPFQGRFSLRECAVGPTNGTVEFGWEATGRYGGIGLKKDHALLVECVDSNEVLRTVIAAHGSIDILKVDIESFERELVERIPGEIAARIDRVYVETKFKDNPLARTHQLAHYGGVAHFVRG